MSDLTAPGSSRLDFSDDSPYLDFGMDGEIDDSFDYEEAGRMIGDLPEEGDTSDLHDKRKSIGDDDDDDEGGGKRREGEDKTGKKPGRKPLTSEPTTKRKAQNRAAQRAFRDRKERHLKDLETKVEHLEKASESTTHENGLLRAQVERLQIELKEYRKRLSWVTTGSGRPQPSIQPDRNTFGSNDFSFEFPKFGDLPSANFTSASPKTQNKTTSRSFTAPSFSASPVPEVTSRSSVPSAGSYKQESRAGSIGNSPVTNIITASPGARSQRGPGSQTSIDSLSALFSPSVLEAAKHNLTGYFPDAGPRQQQSLTSRQSIDSQGPVPGLSSHSSTNTDSPGSSSESQQHFSSIGTSPEPLFNSPSHKQDYGLSTINEINSISEPFGKDYLAKQIQLACGNCDNPIPPALSLSNVSLLGTQNFTNDPNTNNFDWLAQQNGGGFDPVLFGDYRETQDNVISQDFGSFFNDAYPLPELGSPQHNYGELPATTTTSPAPKPNLLKRVDAAREGEEMVPGEKSAMLTCNKIWDRLQSLEKFRNGEIDIDNLCSELRSKAKCSEGGAVVDEKHVNKLLGGL